MYLRTFDVKQTSIECFYAGWLELLSAVKNTYNTSGNYQSELAVTEGTQSQAQVDLPEVKVAEKFTIRFSQIVHVPQSTTVSCVLLESVACDKEKLQYSKFMKCILGHCTIRDREYGTMGSNSRGSPESSLSRDRDESGMQA